MRKSSVHHAEYEEYVLPLYQSEKIIGAPVFNEYKVYIVGDKKQIDKVLQQAQWDELIDSYQIGD